MVDAKNIPGLNSPLTSEDDIKKLKVFLKGMTNDELEQLATVQVGEITTQYLLVNRTGTAIARIFLDDTKSALNSQRFENAGYALFKEKSFSGNLHKTMNYCTEDFWSCSCKDSYIHHRNQIRCKQCELPSNKDTKKYTPLSSLKIQ
jgi:hypothetical protein